MTASSSPKQTPPRPVLGVSACLLGQRVRFDGGHKRAGFITATLLRYMDLRACCPETAIGLGVPRPPIRLVGDRQRPRALSIDDARIDVTEKLEKYAYDQTRRMDELSGFVLKKGSPSCGMKGVKVYGAGSHRALRKGSGIFARILAERRPLLPTEEEDCLDDDMLRENFINRIYVYQRWQALVSNGLTAAGLVAFHIRHQYLVMAHSQTAYRRLGRLLSNPAEGGLNELSEQYIRALMHTLKRIVSRRRHVDTLQHILGDLKKDDARCEPLEIDAAIEAYRREQVPLTVPITRLRQYVRRHPKADLRQQYYLYPYPDGLGLRDWI